MENWMSVVIGFHVLVALAIIGLVLLQHGKGADVGSGFGGGASGSLFGATGSANFLSRTTAILATVFFLTSLGLAYLANTAPRSSGGVLDAVKKEQSAPAKGDAKGAGAQAAKDAGARWLVLCDTNGGTLPAEVHRIVAAVAKVLPGDRLGIHAHNDTENAVANSLAAVAAGARQVQGTINGLGERCGNANLVSLIPSLKLKTEYEIGVTDADLARLTHVSRTLDELLNRAPNRHQAYVGEAAFAHKGGLHVSAVAKDPRTYEHIEPHLVGNRRVIVVSDQAGRSNVVERLRELDIVVAPDHPKIGRLVEDVKAREHDGYAYDGAEASFELLARELLEGLPRYFEMEGFRIDVERRFNAVGTLITVSQAVCKLTVGGRRYMEVGEGNGPVDALDHALRKALLAPYPSLADMRLTDYKVRILTPQAGTAAVTRVLIESADRSGRRWSTVGISPNIIDASYQALKDAIYYKLLREKTRAAA